MGFPNGYDTWIEQGGVNVSGGQKQRLCIARALLKKPPILILDDSTSAVDTATERRIRDAFDATLSGTTKFIIAQRISSVKDADQIVILSDGEIADVGTDVYKRQVQLPARGQKVLHRRVAEDRLGKERRRAERQLFLRAFQLPREIDRVHIERPADHKGRL